MPCQVQKIGAKKDDGQHHEENRFLHAAARRRSFPCCFLTAVEPCWEFRCISPSSPNPRNCQSPAFPAQPAARPLRVLDPANPADPNGSLVKDFHEFLSRNGFMVIEIVCDFVQLALVFPQNRKGLIMLLFYQFHDLLVDLGLRISRTG